MAASQTCPDLEDLAALLEGVLPAADRAIVIAHLSRCETCYTSFSEAAAFHLEEEAGDHPVPAAGDPRFHQVQGGRRGGTSGPSPVAVASNRERGDSGSAAASQGWEPAALTGLLQQLASAPWPSEERQRVGRRSPWLLRTAALAAAILLVAGPSLFRSPPYQLDSGRLLASASMEPARMAVNIQGWSANRGASASESESRLDRGDLQKNAFQLGARLVELQVALSAENPDNRSRASDLARGIHKNISAADMSLDLDKKLKIFSDLDQAANDPKVPPLAGFKSLASTAEPSLDGLFEFDKLYLNLGKWVAATKLSLDAGDPRVLESRSSRRFLAWLLEQPSPPMLLRQLREIAQQLEDGKLDRDGAACRRVADELGAIRLSYASPVVGTETLGSDAPNAAFW